MGNHMSRKEKTAQVGYATEDIQHALNISQNGDLSHITEGHAFHSFI